MKYLWVVFFAIALLVGCGTTVPLSEVPVVDAKPVAASQANGDSDGAGVKGRAVAPVDLGNAAEKANLPSEPRTVYFDYDSFVIRPEYQSVIAAHSRFLKSHPSRKVALEGHTDETGGREYNLALGQKRADAVRDALSILGVQQIQMESVSFGKEKPAVSGADEGAYSKNRRTEIRYQ